MTDKLSDRVVTLRQANVEIDAEIFLELEKPDWRDKEPWKLTNGWFRPNCAQDAMAFFFHDGMGRSHLAAPKYTESLDAAAKLVPYGWGWTVGNKSPEPSLAWCEIDGLPWADGYGWAVENKMIVEAASPALSLCAAALRARGL